MTAGHGSTGHRRLSATRVCSSRGVARARRNATIPRDINEDARNVARALYDTPAFEQSRRERKRVEMLFARLKRILKLGRLRLRGSCGAKDEFLLAATARNLRKLAKLRAKPPPSLQPA